MNTSSRLHRTSPITHQKDHWSADRRDGSSNGNPPERCPRPLYSTQEDHTIPHHHQGEKLKDLKAEIKKEEEETLVSGAQQSMEADSLQDSQDSTQEDQSIPHHHQIFYFLFWGSG
ncbi:uncharacterized protein LOC143956377 [Lithobates pipiens]